VDGGHYGGIRIKVFCIGSEGGGVGGGGWAYYIMRREMVGVGCDDL
jgi:hypothetical protein